MELLWKVSANCAFPQNLNTRKLGKNYGILGRDITGKHMNASFTFLFLRDLKQIFAENKHSFLLFRLVKLMLFSCTAQNHFYIKQIAFNVKICKQVLANPLPIGR